MPNTHDALMQEYQIPISLRTEVEDLLDEIIRLRKVVATYGKIEWSIPREDPNVIALFTTVLSKVAFAAPDVKALFAAETDKVLTQIAEYVEQRRHLVPKEDA
jgi:hypothetical protein